MTQSLVRLRCCYCPSQHFVSHAGTISFLYVCVCVWGGGLNQYYQVSCCSVFVGFQIPRPFGLESNTPQFSDVYPVYLSIIGRPTIITRCCPQNLLHVRTEPFCAFLFIRLLFSSFLSFYSFCSKSTFTNKIFQEKNQRTNSFDPDLGSNFL